MTAAAIPDLERSGLTRDQVEAPARWGEAQGATRADLAGGVVEFLDGDEPGLRIRAKS